ncbi:hypothetical protein LPMP_330090 [Leishmania panamensis]|uniref:Centrosomal protein CEP104 N-terminal domain-containing protein n=1 Tax=Leishmania panamensis TaxID=5679 RepID=A0A088SHJ5_LEIPA|nr:hypothetical protein LPMP_330090 [Leishmania panamensis]AIO01302.1 hypothetical protein LPMP_330090 [Leishmania panamensis]
MSVVLPYDVLFCTSEDPHHPVSELGGCTGEVKPGLRIPTGWQSARHGKTPQTLVIRFHGNVWLQQLRILSHEAKIATKVEVRVAKLTEDDDWDNPPSFRNVRFVKLGSVDFNSNEQSHFRSKERKTVHLKTEAYFLKLLFDRPFINPHNTGHQVGIYSLECSGYLIEPIPFHADRPPEVETPSQRRSSALSPTKCAGAKQQTSGAPPVLVPLDDQRVRRASILNATGDTLIPLVSLTPSPTTHLSSSGGAFRSVRILEFEDFFLRRSEELVSLKTEAVALEDYHVAAECRDKLALLNERSKDIYELEQDKVQAIIDEEFDVAQQVKARMNALVEQLFAQTSLPFPAAASPPPSERCDDPAHGVASHSRHISSIPSTRVPMADAPHHSEVLRDVELTESDTIEAIEETGHLIDVSTLESQEKAVAHAILSCAGSKDLSSVALANPDFDIEFLTAAVGRFTVACLFSRRFQLREAALNVLTEKMDMLQSPAPVVQEALLRFLDFNGYGLQDTIPNVVFAACAFVRGCLADTSKCISAALAPLVALLPRLVTRCSDSIQRIRDEAHTTLALYVKNSSIPHSSILSVALMEPTDKEGRSLPLSNAKAQLARLSLFQLLLENGRLHLDSGGINPAQVLHKLLLPTVNHPYSEVRDVAALILGKLVAGRQLILRDKDLAKVTHASIRESIASKR